MELSKTTQLMLVIVPALLLALWNVIRIVKKAYREGKEFDGRKIILMEQGQKMRKQTNYKQH